MSFAAALRNHMLGSRNAICEHCNTLVSPDDIVRIMRAGQQTVLWEGCYDCLETRLEDEDRPGPSYDLLRRAYLALTTPLSVQEHTDICDEIEAVLADEDE